jgi:hypothetical protein
MLENIHRVLMEIISACNLHAFFNQTLDVIFHIVYKENLP